MTGNFPVSIAYPPHQATVFDSISIVVTIGAEIEIISVNFFINLNSTFTDTLAPWRYEWDLSIYESFAECELFAIAYDINNKGSSSDTITVTIGQPGGNNPPLPVNLFKPGEDDVTSSSVFLSWSKSEDDDFTFYKICYSRNPEVGLIPSNLDTTIEDILDTTHYVQGLGSDSVYYFKVFVADSGEMTSESNEVRVKTPRGGGTYGEMVFIPRGYFVMGDTPDGYGNEDHPDTAVFVPGFFIDKYEVTNEAFADFLNDGNAAYYDSAQKIQDTLGIFSTSPGYKHHPVEYVSWEAAHTFANWAGKGLPTEAEWEKAARGVSREHGYVIIGSDTVGYGYKYPWDNGDYSSGLANCNNVVGETTPVGGYPDGDSQWEDGSVSDLAGNVAEWTADWYGAYRSTHQPPISGTHRVVRGGGWNLNLTGIPTAARSQVPPSFTEQGVGFRCVADAK